LRIEYADDPMMHVSHETIYQSLFVQGRGELRHELTRCLRSGRINRLPRKRPENTGQRRDMVMISERSAEADDRAVPGHWEGDLIIGKGAVNSGDLAPSHPRTGGPPGVRLYGHRRRPIRRNAGGGSARP